MRNGIWLSTVVVAFALGVGGALLVREAEPDQKVSRLPARPVEGPAPVLPEAPLVTRTMGEGAVSSPARPTPESPPPAAEPAEDKPTSVEQALFQLAQRYEGDAPADSRALALREEISNELRTASTEGASLESIECRKSLCRAVLRFTNIEADKKTLNALIHGSMDGPVGRFGMTVGREASDSGAIRTTLFMKVGSRA